MKDLYLPLYGLVCLLLLTSPCYGLPSKSLSRGLTRDRSALLALVNSMDKLGKSRMGAWKARGNPCLPKAWPHITCTNGRVTAIDLANLELVGTLPAQLKRLDMLQTLNMENNQLAGGIPEGWSDRQQFQKLQVLNLANNLLSGSLPDGKWNRKNAFRSLEELNLAENRLSGGLPSGWLGKNKPFRKLKQLDLSDNNLGQKNGDDAPYKPGAGSGANFGWCLQSTDATSGWCPTGAPPNDRLPSLEILDLSQNNLKGEFPLKWPKMFPNLQSLLIWGNQLYNDATYATTSPYGSLASPAALPTEWTQRTVPRAFPQLQYLVLFPGNDKICSIPSGDGTWEEINGELSYVVQSEDETEYDSDYPAYCPGPDVGNPATAVTLAGETGDTLTVSWVAPTQGDHTKQVYGYRVSIYKKDVDTGDFEPVEGWLGRMFKTFGKTVTTGTSNIVNPGLTYTATGTQFDLHVDQLAPALGALETGDVYQIEVTTYNLNGEEAAFAASAEFTIVAPTP